MMKVSPFATRQLIRTLFPSVTAERVICKFSFRNSKRLQKFLSLPLFLISNEPLYAPPWYFFANSWSNFFRVRQIESPTITLCWSFRNWIIFYRIPESAVYFPRLESEYCLSVIAAVISKSLWAYRSACKLKSEFRPRPDYFQNETLRAKLPI